MKWLLVILVIIISFSFTYSNKGFTPTVLMRDTVPTGAAPQLFGGKLYEFKNYTLIDSFLMVMGGDTFAIPRWPAIKYKNSDNRWYGYHGTRWRAFLNGTDTISLSNRISNIGVSNGIRKPNDTIKLGTGNDNFLDSTVVIKTQGHRWVGSKNRNVLITNVSTDSAQGGAAFWENPTVTSEGSQQPKGLNVTQFYKESWGDTLGLLYGGPILTYWLHKWDTVSPRYAKPGGKDIAIPYTGFNSTNRIFLPKDSVNIFAGTNGHQGGEIVADWSIGDSCGYNAYIYNNGALNNYPLASIISHIDLQRNLSRGRLRKFTGTGIAGFFADYKDYQGSITPTTIQDGAYHSKIYDFYSAGERIESVDPATTKAYILGISKNDTVIGFYSAPKRTPTNNVNNGYGFVSDGEYDYNFLKGRLKIGGTMPSVLDTLSHGLHVDSTARIGAPVHPTSVLTPYLSGNWRHSGLNSGNILSKRRRGAWFRQEWQFDSPASFSNVFAAALTGETLIQADSAVTIANNSSGSNIGGGEVELQIEKRPGYADTTTFTGGTTPQTSASAFKSILNVSTAATSGTENIFTGYWSALTPLFQYSPFNKMDNAIWLNIGVGQFSGAANNVTNAYGLYINSFSSSLVQNKYAIFQAGTVDTNYYNGINRFNNIKTPPSTYNLLVHGLTDSTIYQIPASTFATGNTLYTGDGSLPTDRTVTAGSNTLTVTGSAAFADGAQFDVITSGSVGIAIRGQSTDGRGVMGLATTGVGVYGSATGAAGYGLFGNASGTGGNAIYGASTSGMVLEGVINPTSTNTVIPTISLTRSSQSAGGNGIGQSIDLYNHTSTSDQLANQIVSKWTDATNATRTSQLEFYGVNSATAARKAAIAGTGQWTWDGYPALTAQVDTTTYKPVAIDASGNVVKMAGWSGAVTTIYNGDGTVTGNRSVNLNNLNLTFSDVNTFRINHDVFAQARADGTFPYSNVITAPSQQLWMAYTPTAGVFSKGAAVIIDTNNNVSLGSGVMPTTAPLYTSGSAYIQGLQSSNGNFYRVSDISADQTLNLTYYWVNVDATSGNVTITLPAASTAFGSNMGIQYVIRRVDNTGNTVTISRAGSDTINGATTTTLTAQYEVKELQCVSTSAWAIK